MSLQLPPRPKGGPRKRANLHQFCSEIADSSCYGEPVNNLDRFSQQAVAGSGGTRGTGVCHPKRFNNEKHSPTNETQPNRARIVPNSQHDSATRVSGRLLMVISHNQGGRPRNKRNSGQVSPPTKPTTKPVQSIRFDDLKGTQAL